MTGESHEDPRIDAGMIRCCPRKNEADAMVSAALMRQRCRAIRAEPERPLRIILRSPAAAIAPTSAKR